MQKNYCADLQGGMWLQFNVTQDKWMAKPCCLYKKEYPVIVDINAEFWQNPQLQEERKNNLLDHDLPDNCQACRNTEKNGNYSRRQCWNDRLGTKWQNPESVIELDIQSDFSCNLACRICGPKFSTLWRQVETQEKYSNSKKFKVRAKNNDVIDLLSTMPAHDLRQIHFQGGEPFLSNTHIDILEKLQDIMDPGQITVWYHVNGTVRVPDQVLKFWEKFKMLEIYFSLDDLGPRMEYQRWPCDWNEINDNLMWYKNHLPHNGLLRVERTVGVLTAAWVMELELWHKEHFSHTLYGDEITINYHDCRGVYSLDSLSQEYKDHLLSSLPIDHWVYNRVKNIRVDDQSCIHLMLKHLNTHDTIRNQNWQQYYPEFLIWYQRYL